MKVASVSIFSAALRKMCIRDRRYAGDERIYWIIDYDVFVFTDTNLIDALIQTIEWLLTNEHGLWI